MEAFIISVCVVFCVISVGSGGIESLLHAGTEPAGDIVSAQYNKVVCGDGEIEYKYMGAYSDPKKTKELQDQGKRINLSLSEMSQFFMKMAEGMI